MKSLNGARAVVCLDKLTLSAWYQQSSWCFINSRRLQTPFL
jgi:hypothetical protein